MKIEWSALFHRATIITVKQILQYSLGSSIQSLCRPNKSSCAITVGIHHLDSLTLWKDTNVHVLGHITVLRT